MLPSARSAPTRWAPVIPIGDGPHEGKKSERVGGLEHHRAARCEPEARRELHSLEPLHPTGTATIRAWEAPPIVRIPVGQTWKLSGLLPLVADGVVRYASSFGDWFVGEKRHEIVG